MSLAISAIGLAFCLYLGIAAQGFGLLVFGMIIPGLSLTNSGKSKHTSEMRWVGSTLLLSWLIFPFFNVLHYLFANENLAEISRHLSLSKLFKSEFSSVWAVSSSAILLFSFLSRDAAKFKDGRSPATQNDFFEIFLKTFAFMTIFVFLCFLVQHLTGLDLRTFRGTLSQERLVTGGVYRTSGFFSHPLSAAGVNLALFYFFWVLGLAPKSFSWSLHLSKPAWSKWSKDLTYRCLCLFIATLNAAMLLLTGGRAATISAALLVIATPLWFWRSIVRSPKVLVGTFLFTALMATIFLCSDMLSRFLEIISKVQQHKLQDFERATFWDVYLRMFLDKPFFGQGAAQIANGVRDHFYQKLGYASFYQKYNAHNIYLEILASVGLVGSCMLAGLLGTALKKIYRWSKDAFLSTACFWALLLAIIANAINAFTQNVFFDANVLAVYFYLFWILHWSRFSYSAANCMKIDGSE